MAKLIDLTGEIIGRRTILARGPNRNGATQWWYQCECGTTGLTSSESLRTRKSCGCLKRELAIKRSTKHGHAKRGRQSPAYGSWCEMRRRCEDPNHLHFSNWGGRGIKVCESWHDFRNFLADMGEPPDGMSLDRIDNDGNYEKSNCRWATDTEQGRNQRTNRLLTVNGETHCVTEWAEITGIAARTMFQRIHYGWNDYDVVMNPIYARRHRQTYAQDKHL